MDKKRPPRRKPRRVSKGVFGLVKATFSSWSDDRAPKMAAALAYYTAFAVAPLLLIAIAVAGSIFGQEAARGEVVNQISGLVGQKGAEAIQEILQNAWNPEKGRIATLVGILAFLVAATGVFGELQDSLNQIWKVRKRSNRGILGILKDRFLSMMLVLGIGFLLLVSLLMTTALQAMSGALVSWGGGGIFLQILGAVLSFAIVAALFTTMFKVLPDARTRWRDAWIGGLLTALLFTLGKFLIGLYLGKSTVGTTYGAAGSFVLFLLWVNYSAQILFLGAEFTKTYADLRGTTPKPDSDAYAIECTAEGVRHSPA
jgi:membrane protein